jgi:putative acetyltransferase
MGSSQMSQISLRPFLSTDIKRCLAIFRDAIDGAASEDYSEDQREAWKSRADDAAAFGARIGGALTLLASIDGAIVGFASLKAPATVEMLYVDPEYSRRGVGAALVDALVRLAQARGADEITSDVSDTAKPLFERQGFVGQRRNLVEIGEEWLGNTSMTKSLAKSATPPTRH